ncbi:MAG: hypothetical protein NTZ83_02445 [Candidatus Pacearchaeota archaeon]|nr:hypothetical protein [Candidatus Pacearchaeota archaeon]
MNKRGKNKYFSHYNFFPKNRRGSHVEVIISFIIFITFIIFIFASIKSPINRQEDKKNIFDSIEVGIINKISSDMTVITATLASEGEECVNLNNFTSDLNIGGNILVKGPSGGNVGSHIDGDSLEINRESNSDEFFKIYYSEEFDELGTNSGCEGISYEIGLTKTSEYIFEEKFLEMMNDDYEALKTELDIPKGVNFGYGMILSNGTTLEKTSEEVSANIYIRETPVEYVDLEGNVLEGYLKTRIW